MPMFSKTKKKIHQIIADNTEYIPSESRITVLILVVIMAILGIFLLLSFVKLEAKQEQNILALQSEDSNLQCEHLRLDSTKKSSDSQKEEEEEEEDSPQQKNSTIFQGQDEKATQANSDKFERISEIFAFYGLLMHRVILTLNLTFTTLALLGVLKNIQILILVFLFWCILSMGTMLLSILCLLIVAPLEFFAILMFVFQELVDEEMMRRIVVILLCIPIALYGFIAAKINTYYQNNKLAVSGSIQENENNDARIQLKEMSSEPL